MDLYADRVDAGRRLAPAVARAVAAGGAGPALVLALPRGGVPVAVEVAAALGAPLDIVLVRKLGVPDQAELAFGAIASGGAHVVNPDVVAGARLDDHAIAAVVASETAELARRERRYRGDRPVTPVSGRTVVVVDDGLATGATMRAAVQALRSRAAAPIVVAAPVGSDEACALVALDADAVVCPLRPRGFRAVGAWYEDFAAVDDATVIALLDAAASTIRRA
ncbi:Putative phosphoribosyl transferase [Baekduia alba]|uniref:phosphoribosyltransferase n=1 Tax=Baekduia alba TaxID=2997333 RepID=UPI0023404869|nr:phosphoribosyltransferase family protein [Baekduia alba]WCB94086.1 Putative phosphoribosyl transferase [Baekduia alba]